MPKKKSKAKARARTSGPRKSGTKPRSAPKAAANDSRSLSDWRTETLAEVRRMIQEADPEIVEERKWAKPSNPSGVPVWSHDGIVCTGETYKEAVKLTFARGASLEDPQRLFNSGLEGGTRRAIDIREGEILEPTAFKALIQAAVLENLRSSGSKSKSAQK